jgi:predicted phosphodiesterase
VRLAVFTDAHANLPALRAALSAIGRDGVDAIYHTGDLVGIGPHPAECVDLLLGTPSVRLVMGNHDAWFAAGIPEPRPSWMSADEAEHHRWVRAQLDPALRATVGQWPYVIDEELDGVRATFVHYGLNDARSGFQSVIAEPTRADLDRLFAGHASALVFYGHHHPTSDVRGRAHYVNAGSLGCHAEPVARYVILDTRAGEYTLDHRAVPYDPSPLFADLERRQVPAREFIQRTFLPRLPRGS